MICCHLRMLKRLGWNYLTLLRMMTFLHELQGLKQRQK
ncbi:hypothetical protein X975_11535, partial [Stegodyphus mimosarum]